MKAKKVKPVYGNARAKCPDCGESFEYPLYAKGEIFDRFGRFRSDELGWVYKRYHKCKQQSKLETFK